nr:MAG TPA: hypothetical protein [Caudoviricetes sp.]
MYQPLRLVNSIFTCLLIFPYLLYLYQLRNTA